MYLFLTYLIVFFLQTNLAGETTQRSRNDNIFLIHLAKYHRVCYFTNWGVHRSMKEARLRPEDIPPDLCTHIFYAFASIGGLTLQAKHPNDLGVYQGEQVRRKKIEFDGKEEFSLAIVSSNYEIERKKSGFEGFDFLWRMGKFRRIRFDRFIGIITVRFK